MNYIQMAIQIKKKRKLKHFKTAQLGFSFFELMVVLALIGLLGAFVVPNLFRTKQGAHRKEFLASFDMLLKDAVLRSIIKNQVHQVFIDIAHGIIQIREYDKDSIETKAFKKFKKVQDQEYTTEIPSKSQKDLHLQQFKMQNFFINGIEEMIAGNAMQDVSFYVMPDGTSQAIIANLIDEDEDGIQPEVQFSYVINPFYARMSVYETFQTP